VENKDKFSNELIHAFCDSPFSPYRIININEWWLHF